MNRIFDQKKVFQICENELLITWLKVFFFASHRTNGIIGEDTMESTEFLKSMSV